MDLSELEERFFPLLFFGRSNGDLALPSISDRQSSKKDALGTWVDSNQSRNFSL